MPFENLQFLSSVKRMPLLHLPVATPVVQLGSARLLLSPGTMLTDAELRSAGAITDIVAPSLLHTAGVPKAVAVFPGARVWGPAGAAKVCPDVKWAGTLGVDPWPYDAELPFVTLGGMPKIQESVFFHAASRALLMTDLVFNIEEPRGFGAGLILRVFGTHRRFAVSRLFLRFVKDDAAFRDSVQRLMAFDFDSVVPSHGAAVAGGGKARLEAAFRERGYLS